MEPHTQTPPRRSRACLLLGLWLVTVALQGCGEGLAANVVGGSGSETDDQLETSSRGERALTRLEPIGVYETGVLGESAAEITAFDPASARLFVTNASANTVDVLDLSDPGEPSLIDSLDLSPYGSSPTSVALADGLLAIAVAASPASRPGSVVFLDAAELGYINDLRVGALPDMLTFSPDRSKLVIACEGEPTDDYMFDPEGSVAIIDVRGGVAELSDGDVMLAGFGALEPGSIDPQVRIFGPGSSVAQDLEPEYVAISADSTTAYVTLQENNALAIVDLASATVTRVVALGFKDHALPGNGFDLELGDGRLALANWPVLAMYQPDAVAGFRVDGREYLITANEGDARRYPGFDERARVRDLQLDPEAFPDRLSLQRDQLLGRLPVAAFMGDVDGDGDHDRLHAFGSRSVSVWSATGSLVWDSGEQLDRLVGLDTLAVADATHGPSPEGVITAELWGKPYAFVGLEHAGGIVVFDLSQPREPKLVLYEASTREHDLGPEGLELVPAADSPNGEPLLIVANEISGSVRVYQIIAE